MFISKKKWTELTQRITTLEKTLCSSEAKPVWEIISEKEISPDTLERTSRCVNCGKTKTSKVLFCSTEVISNTEVNSQP